MSKIYSVDELANTCQTTARTVRLYMNKCLLSPQRAGRTYVFTKECVSMLEGVMRAKRLGFSLKEIKARKESSSVKMLEEMIQRIESLDTDAKEELKTLKTELKNAKRNSS